jgi:2-methylisocitrate lyase-like PEP mutase family enzyme
MNLFEKFKHLHEGSSPFVLANIWDANSAMIFEAANYQAIGVSSAALSNAFGYNDGENLPFELLLQITKRVTEVIDIPLSVDMEGGYSRTVNGIITNIEKLHDAGAVGINLEDTIVGNTRELQPVGQFRKTLSAIADHLSRNNIKLFLNVRTDGFLLGLPNALEETLNRISIYANEGIDGIFVPCITKTEDIREVVNVTTLPVNVMCMPELPDFEALGSLGVKRISMGPFFFNKVQHQVRELAERVLRDKSFTAII